MTTDWSDDDPWQNLTNEVDGEFHDERDALRIETIEGVGPLDDQFGVHPPKTVPDALREVLFGQSEPSEAEIDRYSSAETVPPMQTYSILDAAKVFGMPEMLGASGLEHRCLFKGDAYDDMKDVAPWIVRLEDGNDFTQKLFTEGKPPWLMWDKEPGVYIRSRATLDTLWKHFRKFTRVQDENGKWFYMRFWEPHAIKSSAESDTAPFSSKDIYCVVAITDDVATIVYPQSPSDKSGPPILTATDRVRHDDSVTVRYAGQLSKELFTATPGQMHRLGLSDAGPIRSVILELSKTLSVVGISRAADVARISVLSLFYGTHFLRDPRITPIAIATLGDKSHSASIRVLNFDNRLQELPRHQVVVSDGGLKKLIEDIETLSERGRLPPIEKEHSGFTTKKIENEFWIKCEERWELSGLSQRDDKLQKSAYFRIALLWGPYFVHDPLHRNLATHFRRDTRFDIHKLIDGLKSRLSE